ncbi:MAG TPA: hypothetical protein VFQ61_32055 [Polyangiaceae bacterium]|nr:hypothetical protein [Polyangiaceae bacterium]
MIKHLIGISLTCFALGLSATACTANVDDPVIDQDGQDGDKDDCVTKCDSTKTTCVGSCTDDGCRGSCETKHEDCVSSCD